MPQSAGERRMPHRFPHRAGGGRRCHRGIRRGRRRLRHEAVLPRGPRCARGGAPRQKRALVRARRRRLLVRDLDRFRRPRGTRERASGRARPEGLRHRRPSRQAARPGLRPRYGARPGMGRTGRPLRRHGAHPPHPASLRAGRLRDGPNRHAVGSGYSWRA